MRTKLIIIAITIIALIGIGWAIVVNRQSVRPVPLYSPEQTSPTILQDIRQTGNQPISFKSLPSPVIPPFSDTVKEIGEDSMVVTGGSGDMTLPMDDSVVKLFRRDGDQLIPLELKQLKQGDQVQVNIIKPGELVHLILQ